MENFKIYPNKYVAWSSFNVSNNNELTIDIPMSSSQKVPRKSYGFSIDLEFKSETQSSYMIIAKDSLNETPIRLSNSIVLIDKSHLGNISVNVDNISKKDVTLVKGKCYFQIIIFKNIIPKYIICKSKSSKNLINDITSQFENKIIDKDEICSSSPPINSDPPSHVYYIEYNNIIRRNNNPVVPEKLVSPVQSTTSEQPVSPALSNLSSASSIARRGWKKIENSLKSLRQFKSTIFKSRFMQVGPKTS